MGQTDTSWPFGDGEMAGRIRDFDWSATPFGPIASWSERLRLAVELTLGSPLVSSLVCGPDRRLIYNDAAARHFGDHHPAALGRPLPDTFPEGWKTVAPFYARAFGGETVRVAGQPLDTRGEGVPTDVFDALLTPMRESDGQIAYVHMTGDEVGDRTQVEAALRETATRRRLLVESWAQAEWETDAIGAVVADSPSWRAYTGQTLEQWLGYGWLGAIHPDDRAFAEQQWRDAIAARGLVNAEVRLRAPDGQWRWTNVRALPMLDDVGNVVRWTGLNIDIDARKLAEARTRERERDLARVQRIGLVGGMDIDVANGLTSRRSPEYLRLHGLPENTTTETHADWLARVHPEDREDAERTLFDALSGGASVYDGEYRIIRVSDGEVRWVHAVADIERDAGGQAVRVVGAHLDITEQKRLGEALKKAEARQSFLLRLSDALRLIGDPVEIQRTATRLLGEQLEASRVFYVEVERDGDTAAVLSDYTNGVASRVGHYSLSAFSTYAVGEWRAGRTATSSDVNTDPHYSEAERKVYASVSTRAGFGIPLIKEERLVAIFGVNQSSPRPWSEFDIYTASDVAERTWAAVERARAELALRSSEERFQQFASASSAGLWIRDADTLAMEFVSPAIGTIYGAEPDALLGDVRRWAAMIVPEDRETAMAHLQEARAGTTAIHEFRIQRPTDGAFRWIRNIDFPLRDDGHIPRIGGIAEDITETRRLAEHQGVLLAELQHRVRNIMGLIRSMANRTAPGALNIEDYRSLLEGRLLALARVQTLLTRQANAGGSLRNIIESEVAAQAHHGGQYTLAGPDIQISPKAVEVLTLAFHELATNALKYGALSVPDGRLSVSWTLTDRRSSPLLALEWIEEGAPPREPSTHRGFGSELIEARIPYELGGRGKITIGSEGARCHLEFPLKDGESILETDAPQPATIFGGTLDMTGAPDLTGRTVLVVEDDYYLANDTAAALRSAGAEVLGPCPNEEAARDLLGDKTPTHAVLDLNLGGGGPQFEIARLLKARSIPFVFLTGYDPDVIPAEMADVVRLQKPLPFRDIVEAVSLL